MSQYPLHGIHQKDRIWYVSVNGQTIPFADGIRIWPDGKVEGAGPDPKALNSLKKKIKTYVNGYIKALTARKLEQPGAGDCWYCVMKTDKGESLGDATKNHEHILHHFKDKYYVPSLLMNAVEQFGTLTIHRRVISYWLNIHEDRYQSFEDCTISQIKRSMTRYLCRRLGMAA